MCLTALGNAGNEVPSSAQCVHTCVALSMWVVPIKGSGGAQRSEDWESSGKAVGTGKAEPDVEIPNGIHDSGVQIHKSGSGKKGGKLH